MAREDRGRREVGYCPHCGNDSPQRSVGAHSSGTDDPKGPTNYAFVVCETCDRVLLYQAGYITRTIAQSIVPIFSVKDYKLVWPNAEKLHSSVPNSVRVLRGGGWHQEPITEWICEPDPAAHWRCFARTARRRGFSPKTSKSSLREARFLPC